MSRVLRAGKLNAGRGAAASLAARSAALSDADRRLLDEAVATLSPRLDGVGPARPGTRQSRHMRFLRARNLALMGCLVRATEDRRFERLFFSPGFASLRPYSAGPYAKIEFLALSGLVPVTGWDHLWARAADEVLGCARDLAQASSERLLVAHASVAAMFAALFFGGEKVAREWRRTLARAQRAGCLAQPWFRMQLTMMGSFIDVCGPHVEWLLDPQARRMEVADVACFVRRDDSPRLNDLVCANVRGQPAKLREALYPVNPASTINHLLHYARRCLRNPAFFRNEGLALMVLTWLEEVSAFLGRLAPDDAIETASVREALLKVQRVQVMEKARFWSICDRLRPGRVRRKLIELWHQPLSP